MKQVPSFRACGLVVALALAPLAASDAALLKFANEDPAGLVEMTASAAATSAKLALPTFCASVEDPDLDPAPSNTFLPRFGDFVFGNQTPRRGVSGWSYSPAGLSMTAHRSLVCYVTGPEGVRRASPGLFGDTFDEPAYDVSIETRVVQLPTADNGFVYKYYVDVRIPVASTTTYTYIAFADGFDSRYFDAATSYFCQAGNLFLTSCATPVTYGSIDIKYKMPANTDVMNRYIVTRPLKSGVTSLPVNTAPVTAAAVFVPQGLETRLDNNVAATHGAISDERPEINTGSLGATLAGLSEGNANPISGSFTLSDDTNEAAGSLLGAVVTATFNGVDTAVAVDCGSPTPIIGNPRVGRTCSFSLQLPSTDFATDVSPGTYAPDVSAELSIVAIDARGQQTTLDLPIHVASTKNDKPVFTVAPVAVPDVSKVPTLSCSLADKGSASCGGALTDFITGIAPGPAGAVDELAAQTAAFVPDTANGLRGGNIACVLEGTNPPQLFALNSGPKLTASSDGKKASLSYALTGTAGSTLCTVQVRDAAAAFPAGQTAQTETKTFRITITP